MNETERLLLARASQLDEIRAVSEKRWRVFAWTTGLLSAGLAGAIAMRGQDDPLSRVLVAAAVLVLSGYAIMWIKFNGEKLRAAIANVEKIDRTLQLYTRLKLEDTKLTDRMPWISYYVALGLIALIVLVVVLVPLFCFIVP